MNIGTAYLRATIGVIALLIGAAGCSTLFPQSKGQIAIHVVSWKLVKTLAEPDAGLAGQNVKLVNPADGSVIAEKVTDASGDAAFDIPAGTYQVVGIGNDSQTVTVESGQVTKLKMVKH